MRSSSNSPGTEAISLRDATQVLPVVHVFRQLSDAKSKNYEALVKEAVSLGFEPFTINVPTRRDVLGIINQSLLKRGGLIVQLFQNTAREHGRELSMLSIGVTDNSANFSEVVSQVSDWLGSEPEFPATSAQFFILERAAGRHPVSLAEASSWHDDPVDELAAITVSKFGSGVLLSRILQKAI